MILAIVFFLWDRIRVPDKDASDTTKTFTCIVFILSLMYAFVLDTTIIFFLQGLTK